MTHQTQNLEKYWKLFPVTFNHLDFLVSKLVQEISCLIENFNTVIACISHRKHVFIRNAACWISEFFWAAVSKHGNSLTLLCHDLYSMIDVLGYNNAVLLIQANINRVEKLSLCFANFSKGFSNSSCLDIYLLNPIIHLICNQNLVIFKVCNDA